MPSEILQFQFTPTIDTAIYAASDLLFDTTEITTALATHGRSGRIIAVEVNDKDDEGAGFDIVFLRNNNDAGTINNTPTITDALSSDTLGFVRIAATDFRDVGGNKQASLTNLNIAVPATGTLGTGLYAYGVVAVGATPTYTAATDLVITVHIEVYS